MHVVLAKTDEGVIPPTQNGFKVYANMVEQKSSDLYFVGTGLQLTLPPNTALELESVAGVFILSFSLSGQLNLLAEGHVAEGEQIATAWIVRRELPPIRFMERDDNTGSRIIRGGPAHAECCVED